MHSHTPPSPHSFELYANADYFVLTRTATAQSTCETFPSPCLLIPVHHSTSLTHSSPILEACLPNPVDWMTRGGVPTFCGRVCCVLGIYRTCLLLCTSAHVVGWHTSHAHCVSRDSHAVLHVDHVIALQLARDERACGAVQPSASTDDTQLTAEVSSREQITAAQTLAVTTTTVSLSPSRIRRMMNDVTSRVMRLSPITAGSQPAGTQPPAHSTRSHVHVPAQYGADVPADVEPLIKLFNEVGGFYYSPDGADLFQAQFSELSRPEIYCWNRALLLNVPAQWRTLVMHGFYETRALSVPDTAACANTFTLTLVSRRSNRMAGTRYRRRGVSADGFVANFVETEQILGCDDHHLSHVQIRGSIPLFWSQPGIRYRPIPRINGDTSTNQKSFACHMGRLLDTYGDIHLINLCNQTGRESVLAHAYLQHILLYNSPRLAYTAFDFHHYCSVMRLENVATLIGVLSDQLTRAGFTWRDSSGLVQRQECVFRVNCVDCLDRTNLVQTHAGRVTLERMCVKLGIVAPTHALPPPLLAVFHEMWADNGDMLSRQYAGTAALKADFTRTGERRWTGVMRDGVNSANRYYVNRFQDGERHAAILALLGETPDSALCDQTAATAGGVVDGQEGAITSPSPTQLYSDSEQTEQNVLGEWVLDERVCVTVTDTACFVERYLTAEPLSMGSLACASDAAGAATTVRIALSCLRNVTYFHLAEQRNLYMRLDYVSLCDDISDSCVNCHELVVCSDTCGYLSEIWATLYQLCSENDQLDVTFTRDSTPAQMTSLAAADEAATSGSVATNRRTLQLPSFSSVTTRTRQTVSDTFSRLARNLQQKIGPPQNDVREVSISSDLREKIAACRTHIVII